MNLRRLTLRIRALLARHRVDRDLDDELAFHIERETQEHLANGLDPAEARARAIAHFGSVTVAADECRDARGTALRDNLVRDVRYAGRSFLRAPLVALTIVTTVGLGLGLVAAVFTFFNAVFFRADEVRHPHELFAVERQHPADTQPERFTRPEYEALAREAGVFSDAFAMGPDADAWLDGRRMEGSLVTGNVFHVLGVSAAVGRTLTPEDDEPGGRAIVLGHRAWSRHFAGDPDVVGRTVLVNSVPFHVVGVMPEGFRGLTFAPPDFWAPLSLLGQLRPDNDADDNPVGLQVVGRLKPGLPREQALEGLRQWDSRRAVPGAVERSTADLVLEPRQGTIPLSADAIWLFTTLLVAFGLILMIGCANVANLLFARAVARQREIGIRLAIGASRRRIVWQLLTEGLLLALVSAALGLGLSRLVLAAIVQALTNTWSPAFGDIRLSMPPADWRVVLFLVTGAMTSTLFFALAPALQATRLDLVRAMRGQVARHARPGRARDALVALQVSGSVLLLVCAAIFLRSTLAAAAVDPGIRTSDVVTLNIVNEALRGATLGAVRSEPSVISMAASWPSGLGGRAAFAEAAAPGADGATGRSPVSYQFVSPEYFGVLGIDLVSGRGFSQAERSASAAVAIVSEHVAHQLWPGLDAVGQVLRLEPDPNSDTLEPDAPALLLRTLVVVGVARDVAGFRLGGVRMAGAGVYVPIDAEAPRTSLTMRVHGDPERARLALVDRMTAVDPGLSQDQVATLRTIASLEAYLLGIPFWLTLVLGVLALLLTVSGLFSVLSYLVEHRRREIGVRMALGATSRGIAALVLSQSARPVAIGLIVGSGLTAALAAALLATPAAGPIGETVRLFDPVAYAASLLCIVAACACGALVPALRAGRIDPLAALRQD